MRRIGAGILAVALGVFWAPSFAQVAASSSGTVATTSTSAPGPVLQFDQLRILVPAGQPLPPPDAFEQQYASAAQLLKGDSLEQIRQAQAKFQSQMPKPESIGHMQAKAAVVTGANIAEDVALSHIPVIGMVVESVQGGITSEVRKKHTEHQLQAMMQYSQSMMALYQRPLLLHVSAWNGRLRLENVDTGEITLVQPERQRVVVLQPLDRTYTIQPLEFDPLSRFDCEAAPAGLSELGATQIAGVPLQGFRYHETGRSPQGTPLDNTVTRYASDYTLPLASIQALEGTDCTADSTRMRDTPGGADHLALYEGYAHAPAQIQGLPDNMAQGLMGMMSPQTVLWRGHLHTAPADPALFEIPAGYKPAPPVAFPVPGSTSASDD
jgi:hypothetical protein